MDNQHHHAGTPSQVATTAAAAPATGAAVIQPPGHAAAPTTSVVVVQPPGHVLPPASTAPAGVSGGSTARAPVMFRGNTISWAECKAKGVPGQRSRKRKQPGSDDPSASASGAGISQPAQDPKKQGEGSKNCWHCTLWRAGVCQPGSSFEWRTDKTEFKNQIAKLKDGDRVHDMGTEHKTTCKVCKTCTKNKQVLVVRKSELCTCGA
jgi:hypothetical protein